MSFSFKLEIFGDRKQFGNETNEVPNNYNFRALPMEVCKELEAFWAEVKVDVKEDTWADCYRVLERSKPLLGLLSEPGTFELTVDQRKELEEFLLQVHAFVLKNVERCGSKDSTSFIMRQEAAVDISFFTKKIIELMKYYNLKTTDGESYIINHDAIRCEDLKVSSFFCNNFNPVIILAGSKTNFPLLVITFYENGTYRGRINVYLERC